MVKIVKGGGRGRATPPPSPARGRFLGRNSVKSLKSFPPCCSKSPLQLYLEIYTSSNSHNLLKFLQFSNCTLKSRKEENLIKNQTPFPMDQEIHTETSSLRTLKIMPRNLSEIVRSWMCMRSSRVVRASDSQWRSRNCPGFNPSILRHSGIWGAADEAVLIYIKKNSASGLIFPSWWNVRQKAAFATLCVLCGRNSVPI